MRILFLTEWFEPQPAHKGLTFVSGLRDAGHDLEVATAFPVGMPMSIHRREVMNGIGVNRLPLYRTHDASGVRRSATFLSFFLSALLFGLIRVRRFDVVYAYHPPITVGFAAALFCAVWRKPFVIDVLDLWPDAVSDSGMARPSAVRLIGWICDFVYRRAAVISVPTRGFKAKLVERGVAADKIELIYNFADETKARASGALDLAPFGMNGRFNIVYGGNFGRMQELDVVIAAARLAHARRPAIQLILVGGGSDGERVERLAAEAPDVVRVRPGVEMARIGDVFAAADILLANLADIPAFRVTVPQKVQFYLAMGKPILGGLVGEGAQIVRDAGAGFAVPPGDAGSMADAMVEACDTDPATLAAMGRAGRAFYMTTMSSELALEKTLGLFDNAVRGTRPYAATAMDAAPGR